MTRTRYSPGLEGRDGCIDRAGGPSGSGRGDSGGAPCGSGGPVPRGGLGLDEALARHADGLYTYCLSVLCDPGRAAAAVTAARGLACRHRRRLRRPELLRAWLYALARQACLQLLESGGEPDALTAPPTGAVAARSEPAAGEPAAAPDGRRGEGVPGVRGRARPGASPDGGQEDAGDAVAAGLGVLAVLAWPEAAGTTPEQREALELSGRHGLGTAEIAAVLGIGEQAAGALVAQAACEVERTSTALAVLAAEECPVLTRLGGAAERRSGAGRSLLGPALRGELVRHVDDCPTCRGSAERAAADGPWPGALRGAGPLPLVQAPHAVRASLVGPAFRAGAAAGHGRRVPSAAPLPARGACGRRGGAGEPRFDRRGFPVHRPLSAERAAQLRHRALTSTVIAAVVAAPVVALWAAHRGGPPHTGPVSAVGSEATERPARTGAPAAAWEALGDTRTVSGSAVPGGPLQGDADDPPHGARSAGPAVAVGVFGGRAVMTLSDPGPAPVRWQAVSDAPWLRFSRESGVLRPGDRLTVLITVDAASAPDGRWMAHIVLDPSREVVCVAGDGPGLAAVSNAADPGSRSGAPSTGAPPTGSPTGAPPAPVPSPTGGTSAGPGGGPSPSASPTQSPPSSGSPGPSPTGSADPSPSASASPSPSGPGSSSASPPAPGAGGSAAPGRPRQAAAGPFR